VQCKYVNTLLREISPSLEFDKQTAIILTDESLLLPLLHSLPTDKTEGKAVGAEVNVTMGCPLRQTTAYSLLERLLELQKNCRTGKTTTFYHTDVTGLLSHPYISNSIGTQANDFVYTLADGSQHRMHDIEASYTILMFSNPGCPMCREIMEEITSSPLLNELTERGDLRTLSLYPDEDLEAWHEHFEDMPTSWIRAYDKGQQITIERLYNLSAIPALYLLDKQKRVIIKDGTSVAQIENTIAYLESL
jgi:hypothetical protein